MYRDSPKHRAYWDGLDAPLRPLAAAGQVVRGDVSAATSQTPEIPQCVHRGTLPLIRGGCGSCPQRWTYACDLYGQCIPSESRDGVRACVGCPDHEDESGLKQFAPKETERVEIADTFDRVVVINLKRRPDRLEEFNKLVSACWPFRKPELFEAVDGSQYPLPQGFREGQQGGHGAWGCLQSHRAVLAAAVRDKIGSLLVMEDDASWDDGFTDRVGEFLRAVPDDWQMLFLGGEHKMPPQKISDAGGVVRCFHLCRTQCYAVRGDMIRTMYSVWHGTAVDTHLDNYFGPHMPKYRIYAPDPPLVAQAGGYSDITASVHPTRSWPTVKGEEPLLLLDCPRSVVDSLRERKLVHTGYNRSSMTGIDVGLEAIFSSGKTDLGRLVQWIRDLQVEAIDLGCPLGVWHPRATAELLRRAWPGPVRVVRTVSDLAEPRTPVVVYHVAALGDWREVVVEQLVLLRESGLREVRVTHVGDGLDWLLDEAARQGVDLTVVRSDPNVSHYETFALIEVERLAKEDQTQRPILYLHTKGVSTPDDPRKAPWRRLMGELVVRRWRENVARLGEWDVVGFNWRPHDPTPHFSGNFWIARPEWIAKLARFVDYHNDLRFVRYSCEFWIGSTPGCRGYTVGVLNRDWDKVDYSELIPRPIFATSAPPSFDRPWIFPTLDRAKSCRVMALLDSRDGRSLPDNTERRPFDHGYCPQDGSFLDGLPALSDSDVVILADADAVVQRDLTETELASFRGLGDAVALGWNANPGQTGREEFNNLSPRVDLEAAAKILGTTPALLDAMPVYNCGFMAATLGTWRRIREAYTSEFRAKGPVIFADIHWGQLQFCLLLKMGGIRVKDLGYEIHSHGHYPLTAAHEIRDGKLYYDGQLVFFAHNVKGVSHAKVDPR